MGCVGKQHFRRKRNSPAKTVQTELPTRHTIPRQVVHNILGQLPQSCSHPYTPLHLVSSTFGQTYARECRRDTYLLHHALCALAAPRSMRHSKGRSAQWLGMCCYAFSSHQPSKYRVLDFQHVLHRCSGSRTAVLHHSSHSSGCVRAWCQAQFINTCLTYNNTTPLRF
jgi:hypothetical protein